MMFVGVIQYVSGRIDNSVVREEKMQWQNVVCSSVWMSMLELFSHVLYLEYCRVLFLLQEYRSRGSSVFMHLSHNGILAQNKFIVRHLEVLSNNAQRCNKHLSYGL